MTEAAAYDPENIYAKLLDRKSECHKIYESRSCIAFLNDAPIAEGHTLVIPFMKGHTDFLTMPPYKASELMCEVHKVARAVKEATGAEGINIWSDNGEAAGQKVPHPHFHIVPRKTDDKVCTYPKSATDMLTKDAATPLVEKLDAVLNPKKPLKKAKFAKISDIKPEATGLNLMVKVLEDPEQVEGKGAKFWEALCGDASGTVVLSLHENQKDLVKKDKVVICRNGSIMMIDAHVRLTVNKWGKIEASEEELEGEVDKSNEKNVSATEYELVSTGKGW